jgi:hypothetical protein
MQLLVVIPLKYVHLLTVEANPKHVHMGIKKKTAVKFVNVMIHVIHLER